MASALPSSAGAELLRRRRRLLGVGALGLFAAVAAMVTTPYAVLTVGSFLVVAGLVGAGALVGAFLDKNRDASNRGKKLGLAVGLGAAAALALFSPFPMLTVGWLLKSSAWVGAGVTAGAISDYLRAGSHRFNAKTGARVGTKLGAAIGFAFAVAATWMMAPVAVMPLTALWLALPLLGVTAGAGIGALAGRGIGYLADRFANRKATRPRDLRISAALGAPA